MSKTITVPLAEATDDQMRTFAKTVLGLEIKSLERGAPLRAKIASIHNQDSITLEVEDTAPISAGAKPAVAADDEYVTVIINKTEEVGGDQPVFVSVNGRGMYIERGKPQRIRRRYERVLANAVRDVYDQQGDGPAMVMVKRQVPSYPYSVIQSGAAA